MRASAAAEQRLEAVVREERGRLIASAVRLLGDWDLAEELVQDALRAALDRWPRYGLPNKPAAWLTTTVRRRALDLLRRESRYRERLALLRAEASPMDGPMATGGPLETDDRLRLIFTCCHPALSREAQIALTLRTIGGLSTPRWRGPFCCRRPPWRSGWFAPSTRSAMRRSPTVSRRTRSRPLAWGRC